MIHGLLNGEDTQAQEVLRFVNRLLAEMEQLAVTDWSKRKSKRATVRVTLKRLMRLAQIEGLSEDQMEPLLEWLAREIKGGIVNE